MTGIAILCQPNLARTGPTRAMFIDSLPNRGRNATKFEQGRFGMFRGLFADLDVIGGDASIDSAFACLALKAKTTKKTR